MWQVNQPSHHPECDAHASQHQDKLEPEHAILRSFILVHDEFLINRVGGGLARSLFALGLFVATNLAVHLIVAVNAAIDLGADVLDSVVADILGGAGCQAGASPLLLLFELCALVSETVLVLLILIFYN